MNQMEAIRMGNMQDTWSLVYMTLGRSITDALGIDGEIILREAVRRYGAERGTCLRKRHQNCGLKLNLESLFTYYDLPDDPRFKREKIRLTPQERISNTLVCPIAQVWNDNGEKALGRIYCEEFHHAMFGAYAPKAQINLAKTLTQEGDNHCCFAVYLRPANMDEREREEAFDEFDSAYQKPADFSYDVGTYQMGFAMLATKLIYHIVNTALEYTGCTCGQAVADGLQKTAAVLIDFMKQRADAVKEKADRSFLAENFPFDLATDDQSQWELHQNQRAYQLTRQNFYLPLRYAFD